MKMVDLSGYAIFVARTGTGQTRLFGECTVDCRVEKTSGYNYLLRLPIIFFVSQLSSSSPNYFLRLPIPSNLRWNARLRHARCL